MFYKEFGAVILALTLVSCVQDIAMNLKADDAVAVVCILKKQASQTLQLYKLKEVYGDDASPIEDAEVILYEYDKKNDAYSKVAEFQHSNGNEWISSFEPEYGVEYKLTVNVPGKEEITASTRFPDDLRLLCGESGLTTHGLEDVDDATRQAIKQCFPDMDTLSFWIYCFEIRKGNTVWSLNETHKFRYIPKYVDGVQVQFKEYLKTYKDSCKLWIFPHVESEYENDHHPDNCWGDRVSNLRVSQYPEWFDFHGSSKPYAKYVATDHQGVDNFNITSGQVSDLDWCNLPVKQYVDGLGSWHPYSNLSQWPRVLCPELPLHKSFLRIAHPANFEGPLFEYEKEYRKKLEAEGRSVSPQESFHIIADYSESYGEDRRYWRLFQSCTNEVHFVSEEYDSYLKDLYTAKESIDNFIISTYEIKHIYSNVNGGYGIFGADNVTWDQVQPDDYIWEQ